MSFGWTLRSSLATVTPFKPVSFMVTGEDDLLTRQPGTVVLKTSAFVLE